MYFLLHESDRECPKTSKVFLLKRLAEYGVKILTSTSLKEVVEDGVVAMRGGKEEIIRGMNHIVLAMGVKSVENLSNQIREKASEVYVIGDAKEPRKVIQVISGGCEISRRI